jgi:hypothetical protein
MKNKVSVKCLVWCLTLKDFCEDDIGFTHLGGWKFITMMHIEGILWWQRDLYKKLLCSRSWEPLTKRVTVKDKRSKFCDLLYTSVVYMEANKSLICNCSFLSEANIHGRIYHVT